MTRDFMAIAIPILLNIPISVMMGRERFPVWKVGFVGFVMGLFGAITILRLTR